MRHHDGLHRFLWVLLFLWNFQDLTNTGTGLVVTAYSSSPPVTLKTSALNPLGDSRRLLDYISRPIHWPEIVASSNGVESPTMDVTQSMRPGQTVNEIFGMGLLSVQWKCRTSKPGIFIVESTNGVPGIATNCRMEFEIEDDRVDFTMGYTPTSPLALLATPVLIVDNWFALNVLLKAATDPTPLDSFRQLMGVLYGVAGVAHALDLGFGGSTLLTSFHIPAFSNLPIEGQALACLWCATGPLAYLLSRPIPVVVPPSPTATKATKKALPNAPTKDLPNQSWSKADLGLALYGLVEVVGALVSGNPEVTMNALGVQVIVLVAWFYSQQKQSSQQLL